MKGFEYVPAATLAEVVQVLAREGMRARLLAGGTDLIPRMNLGKENVPDYIVSLRRLGELNYLADGDGGSLRIGALATLHAVEADERVKNNFLALAEAAAAVGSAQVRNVGTVVGNVCSAASAADTAVALLSLGAKVNVVGPQGEREVDLPAFFAGPRRSSLARGEMVKEIVLPAPTREPPVRRGSAFLRVSPRRGMDCSVAAAAATVVLGKGGAVDEVRIGLGAVAATPLRARAAEEILKGQKPVGNLLDAATDAAANECRPIDDIRGSVEYRRQMVRVLVKRAVERACRRASE